MKITLFFAILSFSSCIIANFFATSSCFSLANANKDREINDRIKTEELNVMQNYIQRKKQKMFSQEYDLGIQPKENNLNSYQQKNKNGNTSQLNVFAGSEVKVSEIRGNFNIANKINTQILNPNTYNVPDL